MMRFTAQNIFNSLAIIPFLECFRVSEDQTSLLCPKSGQIRFETFFVLKIKSRFCFKLSRGGQGAFEKVKTMFQPYFTKDY